MARNGTNRAGLVAALAAVAALVFAPEVMAQKGKVTYYEATLAVSTSATAVGGQPVCSGSELLCGDGAVYQGDADSLTGPLIRDPGDGSWLWFQIPPAPPGRFVRLMFTSPWSDPPEGTQSCVPNSTKLPCLPVPASQDVLDALYASRVGATAYLDGTSLTGGLFGMRTNAPVYAQFYVNFAYLGHIWTIRFTPASGYGGCYVRVTRTADKAWSVSTDPSCDYVALVHSKDGSTRNQVHEGLYRMPFSMTFTVPTAPPAPQ